MKTNIYLSFVLLAVISLNNIYSQSLTEQGAYSISGSAAFSHSTSEFKVKTYSVLLAPSFSFFFAKNFEAGIMLNFQYDEQTAPSESNHNRISGVGPIVNVYFGDSKNKPYIGVSYIYSQTIRDYYFKFESDIYFDESYNFRSYGKSSSLNFNFGYLINLQNNIALAPFLQYQFSGRTISDLGDVETLLIGVQFKSFFF